MWVLTSCHAATLQPLVRSGGVRVYLESSAQTVVPSRVLRSQSACLQLPLLPDCWEGLLSDRGKGWLARLPPGLSGKASRVSPFSVTPAVDAYEAEGVRPTPGAPRASAWPSAGFCQLSFVPTHSQRSRSHDVCLRSQEGNT